MTYIGDLDYAEIKERILTTKDKRKRTLLALTFLAGARIGEIVRHELDKLTTPEKKMLNPPLKDSAIDTEYLDNGKKMVTIKVQVEKSGEKRFRMVYLNIQKERELINIIWRAKIEKQKEGGGYLLH